MTVADYKKTFPNSILMSEKLRKNLQMNNEIVKRDLQIHEKIRKRVLEWIKNNPEKFTEIHEKQKGKPKHNEEFKKKISQIKKGRHQSASTEFMKGHKVPIEWIEKMRKRKIGLPSEKRDKSYEELYGNQKALRIKEKQAETHKNKKLSEIHKQAISKGHKQKFEDEGYRKSFGQRFHRKPGALEEKLISLINSNNLPFQYTGNGAFWIGNKNPDFRSQNGKNQVIELLGEYWHQKSQISASIRLQKEQ